MTGRICQRLIDKVWRNYADDLEQVENAEGVYVIGKECLGVVIYLYIGHSNNMNRRLLEHKRQSLVIDEIIKDEFEKNEGANLRIKWVLNPNSRRKEGEYQRCIEEKLGYPLLGNIKGGNDY